MSTCSYHNHPPLRTQPINRMCEGRQPSSVIQFPAELYSKSYVFCSSNDQQFFVPHLLGFFYLSSAFTSYIQVDCWWIISSTISPSPFTHQSAWKSNKLFPKHSQRNCHSVVLLVMPTPEMMMPLHQFTLTWSPATISARFLVIPWDLCWHFTRMA